MKQSVGAVFVCDGEVFFIRREESLRAFPGYISFPGGKVDTRESLEQALFREVAEEVGVDLKQLQAEGGLLGIYHLGQAVSPAFSPDRFEIHFFKVVLKHRPDFVLDPSEIAEGRWARPKEVLALHRGGDMLQVPSTLRIFEAFEKSIAVDTISNLNYGYDEKQEVPAVEFVAGVLQLMPLSPTLPPADRTNAFLLGDEETLVLVDPSPIDQDEYKKFKRTLRNVLKGRTIDHIFLTHHHPDHHHLAPRLARELGVSFMLSEDTHQRIEKIWGEGYLQGVPCHYKQEGDRVVRWKGEDVIAYEVPGHDWGQLALMPSSRRWAIVGDLIQSVGTVVVSRVGGGDMGEYFQSLERMIAFSPRIIFPSHGIPLGGVRRLAETLSHRKKREAQIRRLVAGGADEDKIFARIYPSLPKSLHLAARETIQAHLYKIEQEKKN